MADAMEELARTQPGFIGVESARDAQGFGITVSYWADDASARAWKSVAQHREAQRRAQRWYDSYRVVVAEVTREYESARRHSDLQRGGSPSHQAQ
jgi:heme-degrading monooxygenase HmoA